MDHIQTRFSIRDMENLSGIKAHTIRIWEKRYNLFKPHRTPTNLRYYDIAMLQKLLNVALLQAWGYKISKIAGLSTSEVLNKIQEQSAEKGSLAIYINAFKLSMLHLDQDLFEETYQQFMQEYSFHQAFLEVFIPLLQKVGLEWQSNQITTVHEHFISNLIQEKLYVNIERARQKAFSKDDRLFVLFLPLNEIHELGLLYIYFDLLHRGKQAIYLGRSVPIEHLVTVQELYGEVHFISCFTVKPARKEVRAYLDKFENQLLREYQGSLWLGGRNTTHLESSSDGKIKVVSEIGMLINALNGN